MSYSKTSGQGQFAVRLFGTYIAVVSISGLLYAGMIAWWGGPNQTSQRLVLPPAFLYSSILLVIGSALMHRALSQVKIERQKPFRQALLASLVVGVLFVAMQSYGLWYLLRASVASNHVETGVHVFAFVFAILHAFHFTVAMMFLVFVTLRSLQDRYDHEYYFGVTVCTWFWHVLGIVWLAILLVFYFAIRHPQ